MDERHWWIAQRLAQTFMLDASTSNLEKFICEPNTLEKINNFLCMNGSTKLFFLSELNPETARYSDIVVLENLLSLSENGNIENAIVLYFIRHNNIQEVAQTQIYKEVFCGEIKNVSQILFNVYNDMLLKAFETNKNWGSISETNKVQAIRNMEKYVNGINQFSTDNQNSKNIMLKRVDPEALIELKQPRISSDAPIIKYCEDLANEWMLTIEHILGDISDEKFVHQSVGPSSELDRWQRKQRLLSNLTEQLKTKECKSVVSALITAKSKVLKRWKIIDTGITDAQNECRDKVKFLESLKRPIDQLYQEATPLACVMTALPSLCTSMRTVESVSRYYARQGYLGFLFTKVTNQIVSICNQHLMDMTVTIDNQEYFWPSIFKEIESNNFFLTNLNESTDFSVSIKSRQGETEMALLNSEDSLFNRLRSCLIAQSKYKEAFRNLRDSLGGSQVLSSFPSMNSFHLNSELSTSQKDKKSLTLSRHATKFFGENKSKGILMSDEEIIFKHIDILCNRIKCVIEQIIGLAQYQSLFKLSSGLMRPKTEDLELDDEVEVFIISDKPNQPNEMETLSKAKTILDIVQEENEDVRSLKASKVNLSAKMNNDCVENSNDIVYEQSSDKWQKSFVEVDGNDKLFDKQIYKIESENKKLIQSVNKLFSTEQKVEADSKSILNTSQSLSKEDLKLLRKYYSRNEGPTVSSIIESYLMQMKKIVKTVNAKQILDVESDDSNLFDKTYKVFIESQNDLERFLAAYLNVIFNKAKKTSDALMILNKFKAITQKGFLKQIINDKYVEIFTNYDRDLVETEKIFETHKDNPPLLRNAPPVGGSISWIRQLLKNVEEPMRIFKENRYITSLLDFNNTLKKYNRLQLIMISFENYYLNAWKTTIEEAKLGFKHFLLTKNEEQLIFYINSDERLLLLFQEVKWLARLRIEMPQSAKELLSQEKKFKLFKSNLEMLLLDYKKVVGSIPPHLFGLFQAHVKQTLDLCNPGCFILTWNSLNIDSFLKTVENGIKKLNNLVTFIKDSKEITVYKNINEIGSMYLFDKELAFTKQWNPDEFLETIGNSIETNSNSMHMKLIQIEAELEKIGNLVVILPKDYVSSKKLKGKLNFKELSEIEPRLTNLKDFYSHRLYESFRTCVLESLRILAEGCGFQLDLIDIEDISPELFQNEKKDSTDVLEFLRMKSADNSSIQSRSVSVASVISKATWTVERKLETAFLMLEFALRYQVPDIITDPSLDASQRAVKAISAQIIETARKIEWLNPVNRRSFHSTIMSDLNVNYLLNLFNTLIQEIGPSVKSHMNHFKLFEFLWKEDLNTLFTEFMQFEPEEFVIKKEVERLTRIEKQILEIPQHLNIGPICLNTDSVKTSLKAFSYTWKCKYASVLHEMAKSKLQASIIYRENVEKRLSVNVQTLEQLNDALRLLEELSDMENKIDGIYLPIENIYADLRRYNLIMTRQEIEQVTNLRDNWATLMKNAENVRKILLQDKRNTLEQELDKQVKTFIVEVIRFRNSFDATGPSVVGIDPYEALKRLDEFQKQFETFDARRKTLDSISILFGLPCKSFPELDKTGYELNLLNQLYKVYQVFLDFDKTFRSTLWSDVDILLCITSIKACWEDFLALPAKLKENWEAYFDLEKALKKYNAVLPILLLLNAKEIRNRHWLQVMQYTSSAFRLESAVFRLNDLIDIGFELHATEIEEICKAAKKEQELEIRMKTIEEEWNEQVLSFTNYKDYGEILFDKEYTERLLEQLEDAQEILATMLTSKYVIPMRNEVASWFEKLKTIYDVLELWLEVQDLWINIESVFSNPLTIKEMPAEAKRFSRVDKSWIRSQKQSFDMKSVIQCCLGSSVQENTKKILLKDIQKELEICNKSLNSYLEKKRKTFPRYYFLSNASLLTLMSHGSHPETISSLKPFLSTLFNSITDFKLDEIKDKEEREFMAKSFVSSISSRFNLEKAKSSISYLPDSPTFLSKHKDLHASDDSEIAEVYSGDGETLTLMKKIPIDKGCEVWLPRLKDSVNDSVKKYLSNSLTDLSGGMPLEEVALKYPTQICLIACIYNWTKEAEISIGELKTERKSISIGSKKYSQVGTRLLTLASKQKINSEKPILPIHRQRLEAMMTFCTYLRDVFEALSLKKIKDINDFEWQKCFRVYAVEENGQMIPKFCLMDDSYAYGNEFNGMEQHAIITPLTERCFLTIWQTARIFKGSLICGRPNVGKTQTAKGYAQYLGKFMYILYCTSQTDFSSISNSLQGSAQAGNLILFDEVQNFSSLCLSWFNEYSNGIYQALRKRSSTIQLADGKEITINNNFSILLTYNPLKENASLIPQEIKSMYRVISLMEPDFEMIIKLKCVQYGIKAPNMLAPKLKALYEICQGSFISVQSKYQLTLSSFIAILRFFNKQITNGDSRPNSYASINPSANKYGAAKVEILSSQQSAVKDLARKSRIALLNYSKAEHAAIGQAFIEILSPRLDVHDSKLFKRLVQDVFVFKDDQKLSQQINQGTNLALLERFISEKAMNDHNLFPNKSWIDKCIQIFSVSNAFKGIILCGPPSTGKSSILSVLVDALSEVGKESLINQSSLVFQQSNMSALHRLKRINPAAIDDESLMFGSMTQNGEFKDGLITDELKSAARNQSNTWLCLDGSILPCWSDNFNAIFDSSSYLQLKNGDQLKNMCKIVFECSDISNATPSLVAKSGIVYFGDDLVGWRSLARSWLETRTKNETQCLQRCFGKTMDDVINYVTKECKPMLPVREESLFISCLHLLGAMLSENTNISGEMHIERLFLYCLIWTFGGILEENDQRGFSDLLYRLVTALPDDDLKSSVFEYYVDESGEWDLWSQRVPENVYMDSIDLLGNIFVDTIETIRCRVFMEFSNLAHQNVILFGPQGSGKTKLLQDFVQDFDTNLTIVKRLNFSAATNVSQIQKFIESNIVHRKGFTYGAPEKKQFVIFIDDISIPTPDEFGIRRCNEFIRQVVDSKLINSHSKPFEIKKLEDICFYSTMTYHSGQAKTIDPRLLRHSVLLYLPSPDAHALKSIFNGTLEAALLFNEKANIDADLHNSIVDASVSLLQMVTEVLKPCPTPGRQHYLFNMKNVISILKGLSKLNETQRNDAATVISLWRYEVLSTIGNQLPRYSDLYWFESVVNDLIKEKLSPYNQSQELIQDFVAFNLETRSFDRPATGAQNRHVKINLSPLESMENVRLYIEQVLNRYKEEFGYHSINIFLSENIVKHLIQIHRILTFSQNGNLLLIGNVGNHLSSLIKLALYIAEIQLFSVECSKLSLFYDSMRTAVRVAGSDNKNVGLIFTSKDLIKSEYLDIVNSLLNNGECLHLFTNDEMDGLYNAIAPSLKREYPNMILDPKKFFNSRVQKNLHICLALSPHSDTFQSILKHYPKMTSSCQIYWIKDWKEETLLIEAKNFMRDRLDSGDLKEKVAKCMSEIHSFMLNECRQINWTGSNPEREIKIQQTKLIEKKFQPKETISKTISVSLPNWPYSRNILAELIKLEHTERTEKSKLHFFVGPNTYLRFMNSFWYFFTTKAKQCENDIIRLRRVLETLNKTREGTQAMKAYIKDLRQRCKQAETDSELALKTLIEKTTSVEKLKAKLGLGGSLATLMQMQEDTEINNQATIDNKLLLNEEMDEYDKEFLKMKEDGQKFKQAKMNEELERAKNIVEESRRQLGERKRQVETWKNKIDKACIERIKTFQNPPPLLGQILEMTIALIGKKKFPEIHSAKPDRAETSKDEKADGAKTPKKTVVKPDKIDRNQWKMYLNAMQDTNKFIDLLYSIDWEDGLSVETIQTVESFFMKGSNGQLGSTGEVPLLESPKDANNAATKSADNTIKGITISAARYASEDAAVLVHYAIVLLEYSKLCIPYKTARDKVEMIKVQQAEYERKRQELDIEIHETSPNLDGGLTSDDLPRLMAELEELQKKFDQMAVNKHKLNKELDSCIQRLDAAQSIVDSLTNLEEQWKTWIEEHLSHEQTITNCLITAAYICYCGPFDREIRQKFCTFFAATCVKFDIPKEPQQIFRDFSLPEFLYSPIKLKEIQLLRLPTTGNILENGCFLLEDKSFDNWPLICDSSRRSIDWLKTLYNTKTLFILRLSEIKSVLETCLSEGHYLMLTDCDVKTLMNNRKIETVLRNKNRFISSDKPFKLNLGTQEIECNPKFRLFLHTVNEPINIPDILASYTVVINYSLIRNDVEEELLDRFLVLAKPRIDIEKFGLLQEKVNTLKIIDPLEQDITDFLATEIDLLNSVEPTKRLSDLKKLYDEAVDSNTRIESAEEPLIKTRESYREIALRGAICYDIISCLKEINVNYVLSFKQFMKIFDDSLYQFERSSSTHVINKLTQNVFNSVSRMMSEPDKKVYSLLLSIEIESASGRLRPGEREFVISPIYGANFIQLVTNKQFTEHKLWQSKKSFDWMLDDQFLNLQYLALSQSWFADPFDKMARDGRETQWRTLCEAEVPENVALPDKLDEVLSPIQRFCIIRAVRGDRILQLALSFVSTVLGKNYILKNNIELEGLLAESSAEIPICLMYSEEPEAVRRSFTNFAKTKVGHNHSIIDINSLGLSEDKQIRKILSRPMEEGSWILLHNCHNSPTILNNIESTISSNSKNLDTNFRCWISLLQEDDKPPTSLMLNSVRAYVNPVLTFRENMLRSFNSIEAEGIKSSNKPEWSILLHNLCYFHSCMKLRSRFIRCGWNCPSSLQFSTEEFLEALRASAREFSQEIAASRSELTKSVSEMNSKAVSFQSIKYIISDLIYGCSASNEYDLQAIETIGESWISAIATRKDFEMSKLKYKIPNSFLAAQPRSNMQQQSLENIGAFQLEAPEACHLLPSVEAVLGDDVLIMTRLGKLMDSLPSSQINVKLNERPLTPTDNCAVPQINMNSTNPLVYPLNSFSSVSYMASQSKKYNELNDYCSSILSSKLIKTLNKEQINEKVKKNGGWTAYNFWIVNELNQISNLINVIRNHLQIIKNATENKKLGCDWTNEIVEVADSLYHQQVPKSWCYLSGGNSTFTHYPLGSYFTDVVQRFQHIEKCLTMGREKNPYYNLGAFYFPLGLLSILKHETLVAKNKGDETGCLENLVFQSEMTSRDKEHLRDPPKEGIFIHGLYLWGCHWEKNGSELIDQSIKTKEGYMVLPVIQITCWLESEKPLLNDISKSQDLFKCPVYANRKERDDSILEIDLIHSGIPAQRWSMRGVCATLKPY